MDGSQLVDYARPVDLAATKTGKRGRWSLKRRLIAASTRECWPLADGEDCAR